MNKELWPGFQACLIPTESMLPSSDKTVAAIYEESGMIRWTTLYYNSEEKRWCLTEAPYMPVNGNVLYWIDLPDPNYLIGE